MIDFLRNYILQGNKSLYMKKDMNKVIIIGPDHHNTLGTVRCFGVNHIKPYGIIVKADDSPLFVTKSKYWEKTWVINDDEKIYDILIENFSNERLKPVVISCSDGSMRFIDMHLKKIEHKFIVPSLNHKQGAITELMDKEKQAVFLKENRIFTFGSQIFDLSNNCNSSEVTFPVILKPIVSAEGDKSDIAICYNEIDYSNKITDFRQSGYQRVLIQHYYTGLTEYLLTGMVTEKGKVFSVYKNIRQWPLKTGSGCYSSIVTDSDCNSFASDLLETLQLVGFSGPIDIEFFNDGTAFFVNEINWRVSGRNYVSFFDKKFSTLFYYFDIIGVANRPETKNIIKGYAINEASDIRSALLSKKVPLFKWIGQLITADSYALWFWRDLKPTFSRYKYYLKKSHQKESEKDDS